MKALVLAAFLGTTALIPMQAVAQPAVPEATPNAPPQNAPPQGESGSQSPAAQQPQQQLLVAPQALPTQADRQAQQTSPPASHSGPVNICQELVAYLQPKPSEPKSSAGSPGAQVAPQASSGQSATAPQAPTVPHQGSASPEAAGRGASPPVVAGQAAPIPKAADPSPAPTIGLDRAQALAQANDLRGCRDAAQQLRRAGVALPSSLIALAALKPELLEATQAR